MVGGEEAADMISDGFLKQDVEEELQWDPQVDDAGVGVAVEDATVRLTGEVDSEAEKEAVLRSAFRVRGVRSVNSWSSCHDRGYRNEPGSYRYDRRTACHLDVLGSDRHGHRFPISARGTAGAAAARRLRAVSGREEK
ncbi:BON domain-containing protein [Microbacterium sp. SL62]|uniref:BON domain-containing protein n=1 Tax=Microbacterium sp. SL62 TaxID=2995139 RepID=UPI003FA36C09